MKTAENTAVAAATENAVSLTLTEDFGDFIKIATIQLIAASIATIQRIISKGLIYSFTRDKPVARIEKSTASKGLVRLNSSTKFTTPIATIRIVTKNCANSLLGTK